MSHTDKLRQQPSLEKLKEISGIAQHMASGNTATSGIRWEDISSVNAAEEALFLAALASIVPGIDPQLHKARQALDHAFKTTFGGYPDKTAHSAKVLRDITYAFDKFGLSTFQLQIT